jgi:hypothetical protein
MKKVRDGREVAVGGNMEIRRGHHFSKHANKSGAVSRQMLVMPLQENKRIFDKNNQVVIQFYSIETIPFSNTTYKMTSHNTFTNSR